MTETETAFHRTARSIKSGLIAALFAMAGCSGAPTPTAQSIQGLTPSGSVTLNETFAAGYGAATAA
jgi:hypothetical protein